MGFSYTTTTSKTTTNTLPTAQKSRKAQMASSSVADSMGMAQTKVCCHVAAHMIRCIHTYIRYVQAYMHLHGCISIRLHTHIQHGSEFALGGGRQFLSFASARQRRVFVRVNCKHVYSNVCLYVCI